MSGATGQTGGDVDFNIADRWIVSRLQQTIEEVETGLRDYRFDLAAQAVYSFVWHEYCDWYLELSKVVLADAGAADAAKRGTRHTLVTVLETLLRVLHPLMPFITEELWQRVAPLAGVKSETIMRQPFPRADSERIDRAATEDISLVMGVVNAVRNIRGEMDISPKKRLAVLIQDYLPEQQKELQEGSFIARCIMSLPKLESVKLLEPHESAPESATALVGNMKVLVPLGSIIDKKAELARLEKEIAKTEKEIEKAKAKLANSDFIARAPTPVVDQWRQSVQQSEQALTKLAAQKARVASLPDA